MLSTLGLLPRLVCLHLTKTKPQAEANPTQSLVGYTQIQVQPGWIKVVVNELDLTCGVDEGWVESGQL